MRILLIAVWMLCATAYFVAVVLPYELYYSHATVYLPSPPLGYLAGSGFLDSLAYLLSFQFFGYANLGVQLLCVFLSVRFGRLPLIVYAVAAILMLIQASYIQVAALVMGPMLD